ncbi:MAG: hypothetical protein ACI4BA_09705 [Prevotella sp.]
MNKEEYKQSLLRRYPDKDEKTCELAWYFHSMEKAQHYISLLAQCNSYGEVANKAVRTMYVSGDICSDVAVKEAFVSAILPFACLPDAWKAHSATHHIRNMLRDAEVIAERKANEERRTQEYRAAQAAQVRPTADVTIQIQYRTDDAELIRQLMMLASQSNAVVTKVEERHFDAGMFHTPQKDLYCLEGAVKDMPLAILNMCSLFEEAEPTVRYISRYIDESDLPLRKALLLAENEPDDDF